jgi:EAL domain-containing protein (putative c-di-GMP-specific phosphodiesterase class I)
MDVAWRAGSNQPADFCSEMREQIEAETKLLNELELAHANSEFLSHSQPQLSSKNREIESVGALIRWNHPQLGLLYPDRFIASLEDSPLIAQIGRWMLEVACSQGGAFSICGNLKFAYFSERSTYALDKPTLLIPWWHCSKVKG